MVQASLSRSGGPFLKGTEQAVETQREAVQNQWPVAHHHRQQATTLNRIFSALFFSCSALVLSSMYASTNRENSTFRGD